MGDGVGHGIAASSVPLSHVAVVTSVPPEPIVVPDESDSVHDRSLW